MLNSSHRLSNASHQTSALDDERFTRSQPVVAYTSDEIVDELPGLGIRRAEAALRPVDGSPVPARDTVVVATRS